METEFEEFAGFQWDQGNSNKNLTKHHVEDWECEQVFFNEPLLVFDDPQHSLVEKRWAAFGRTDGGRLLVVIFTRRGKLLRVISAREMNRKEILFYEENA
jgi:uncharacterized DUF497 family protein